MSKKIVKDLVKTPGNLKSEENLVTKGKGRPKGSKNFVTKSAKEAFHFAFEKNGGARRLATWAKSSDANYGKFMQLYSKLIPVDLTTQEDKIVMKELSSASDAELLVLLTQAQALINKK